MNSLNLKLIFRDINNTKLFSVIAVLGLAVGMTISLLLVIYVRYEFSYDIFHEKAKQIYKLNSVLNRENESIIPLCIAFNDSSIQKNIPEIKEFLQIYDLNTFNGTNLKNDKINLKNINLIYSDPNIHKVFTLEYLNGNADKALIEPGSIVLSRKLANKLFGSINIIGKTLKTNHSDKVFTITGIIENYPRNSHIKIDAIAPLKSTPFLIYNGGCEVHSYALFHEHVNINQGIVKTKSIYNHFLNQRMKKRGVINTNCFLQKLTDVYLESDFKPKGKLSSTYKKLLLYLSLAFVVMVVAIINFINLLTFQYQKNQKIVGIQKIHGAKAKNIAIVLLGKALVYSVAALIIATIITAFLLPSFGAIMESDLSLFSESSLGFLIAMVLTAIIAGLISGTYPVLSALKQSPYKLIQGDSIINLKTKRGKGGVLVIFQFSIMIFLVVCLFMIKKQIYYIQNADLGFNIEHVVAINELAKNTSESFIEIKNALQKIPEIKSVAASYHLLGASASGQYVEIIDDSSIKEFSINEYRVLPGFFQTLGFKLKEGRTFNQNIQSDRNAIILNETAVKELGLSDPLNAKISFNDKMKVIGVIKDFHYYSMEESIKPIMFTCYNKNIKNIMLKIESNNMQGTLYKIEGVLKRFDPNYLLSYVVIKDYFKSRYGEHKKVEKLLGSATAFSLIMSLLGLYILTVSLIQNRTKEIGIRKVNGAKNYEILTMLNKDFVKWLGISFIIACPIAYYAVNKWLKNFAYKTEISWWVFALAGCITLFIALATVSWQTWSAASRNPVEALCYE